MPTIEVPITAFSVQKARRGQKYGQLATLPVLDDGDEVFFRASLTKIPDGATVVSAYADFFGRSVEGGSRTLKVQPVTSGWDSNVTWSKKPTSGTPTATVTRTTTDVGDRFRFDLTAAAQDVVSGDRVDRGWRLYADPGSTYLVKLFGSSAARHKPVLVVEYVRTPPVPSDLHPGGTVAVAKPILTFDGVETITGLRVQIDPAMDEVTPDFDSGIITAAAGYLDLSGTSYPGMASGATTYWRAQQRTGGGWSDWSDWVEMSMLTRAVPTFLAPPAGNVDDGTPTVQWSYAGTQVAFQVRLLDSAGRVLADSGFTPGTDTDWTPIKGLKRSGQSGTIELLIWDDADRVATPGDPEYAMATRAITYVLDPTVDPITGQSAVQASDGPDVTLFGTRTTGIPDEVVIFRDGDRLTTVDGVDVFTGSAFKWNDPTPPLGRPVTYRAAPRVAGKTAQGGTEVTVVPFVNGIWLADADNPSDRVFLYSKRDNPTPEQTQPETSIVHTPLPARGDDPQVVRRRLVRYPTQGSVIGGIREDPMATTYEALLREWAENDAGHVYWLGFGGFSATVIIGDLTFGERNNPLQEFAREVDVSFNYWTQT